MFEKIKNYLKQNIHYLYDVRTWGQIVFGIIVLMISWSGVKAIQTNFELQKQIVQAQQQTDIQKLQNQNLKLQNQYLQTDQYLELAARRQFGKGAPGEKVWVVPKRVALAHTVDLNMTTAKQPKVVGQKPLYQKNLEAWGDFFFHRGSGQ